ILTKPPCDRRAGKVSKFGRSVVPTFGGYDVDVMAPVSRKLAGLPERRIGCFPAVCQLSMLAIGFNCEAHSSSSFFQDVSLSPEHLRQGFHLICKKGVGGLGSSPFRPYRLLANGLRHSHAQSMSLSWCCSPVGWNKSSRWPL